MQQDEGNEHPEHEALLRRKDALTDVGVYIEDPSVKFLATLCVLADQVDHVLDLVYLDMDSFDVLSLGVRDDLFLKMVAIDVNIFVLVCFSIEDGHSVFHCEIDLEVLAEVDHLGHAVDYHILLGLEI